MNPSSGQSPLGPSHARGQAPPGGSYGSSVYAPPAREPRSPDEASAHGDQALEHLGMKRGRFSAWPHVVIAFLMEAALLGCVVGLPFGWAISTMTSDRHVFETAAAVAGLPVGLVGAYFVFRQRWRCIEAFSSRFCVGVMNISLLFVPIIAFVYANVRGIQKLGGK